MPCNFDVNAYVRLAFHFDHFVAFVWRLTTIWRPVLALTVELLHKRILDCGTYVGESPSHATVVSDNHVGIAGQRHARYFEIAGVQVSFVPQIWHLVAKMHVIGKQRLSGDSMFARDYPVI